MDKNQLDSLKEVNAIYRKILALTNQLVIAKASEQVVLITERGELIRKCENILMSLKSLPAGGALALIKEQKDILHSNIMAVVSEDKLSEEKLGNKKDHVEKRIANTVGAKRVTFAYQLNSREDDS